MEVPTLFSPLFLAAALMLALTGVLQLWRQRTTLHRWGGLLISLLALDLASYSQLLAHPGGPIAQFWVRVLLLTVAGLVVVWIFFVFALTGRAGWLNVRVAVVLGALPALFAGVVLTTGETWPLWSDQGTLGSLISLIQAVGPIGVLFLVFTFGAHGLLFGLLLQALGKANAHFRQLIIAVLIGALIVTVGTAAGILGLSFWAPLSSLQLALLGVSLVIIVIVFVLRIGDVTPIAREAVFETMQDSVLVLDQRRRVVDLNAAAQRLIGQTNAAAVGRPVSEVWPDGPYSLPGTTDADPPDGEYALMVDGLEMTFDVRTAPVVDTSGETLGRTMVLRNFTGRERMERALQQRAQALEHTNRLVTALSSVASRLESTPDPSQVLAMLGAELSRSGLECAVVAIDPAGENATIQYVSFNLETVQRPETLTGIKAINHVIPRRLWPGDRILRERAPVWYPNPQTILRRMFPQIPEVFTETVFQLLAIPSNGYICILPLFSGDRLTGAMPIWGADLHPSDSAVLAVFASQVTSILQRAEAYGRETRRARELARANALVLALSRVASRIDSTADFDEVIGLFADELKHLGLGCMVGMLDELKQSLSIRYVSIGQEVVHWAEKVTGRSLADLMIPRRLWPTDQVVTGKAPYWDPRAMRGTLNLFPILPEGVQRMAMQQAGIHLDDPVAYFPITTRDDVIGVMAVWGADLKREDVPALSIFASQLGASLRNAELFESEARRAKELALLLKASEATSSAAQLDDVLLILAGQLLEISGLESCFIAEWDPESNSVDYRLDYSRVFWAKDRRAAYALGDYPRTRQVLATGSPIILQGDFRAEEKRWMDALGRTGVIILPMFARGKIIGLVELATTQPNRPFDPQALPQLTARLAEASAWVQAPVSSNDPQLLFQLQEALMQLCGAEVGSCSEWDVVHDRLLTVAVSARITWHPGQRRHQPADVLAYWERVLAEGEVVVYTRPDPAAETQAETMAGMPSDVETLVAFPLQRGAERIGVVELSDYNHRAAITPAQLALLRTVADKAGYSIQNARLFEQTQQQLNEKTALLKEKEVLLKEVHHRVKNNLQVISSLLNLQSDYLSDPSLKDALRESRNRVRTMALIHEKLYQSADVAEVDFAAYLQSLVSYLTQSYQNTASACTLQLHTEPIALHLETAVPCGLIVNELVSNALKHAFPDRRPGILQVNATHDDRGRVLLQVCDDGVGLPAGLDPGHSPSLGLQLVRSLVDQIRGTLNIETHPGTRITVCLAPPGPGG